MQEVTACHKHCRSHFRRDCASFPSLLGPFDAFIVPLHYAFALLFPFRRRKRENKNKVGRHVCISAKPTIVQNERRLRKGAVVLARASALASLSSFGQRCADSGQPTAWHDAIGCFLCDVERGREASPRKEKNIWPESKALANSGPLCLMTAVFSCLAGDSADPAASGRKRQCGNIGWPVFRVDVIMFLVFVALFEWAHARFALKICVIGEATVSVVYVWSEMKETAHFCSSLLQP